MIKNDRLLVIARPLFIALSMACLNWSEIGFSFPENVRHGYASCTSCHVSPTGGGVLTDYGRGASEEFMATWFFKNENQPFEGQLKLPKGMLVGGDFRTLSFARDTGAFKERRAFPMQMDLEIGGRLTDKIVAVGSLGFYDLDLETQSHYLMTNLNDNFYVRLGRFFPAFGIRTPEHATPTRKGLGFNQGRESYNIEAGFIGETGEIIFDAILRSGQFELGDEEKGGSIRAAWYAGNRSQIGVSAFQSTGSVWNRQMFGVFAIAGLTQDIYVLSEADRELKRPADKNEPSTPANSRVVTYNKLGWEFSRGMHIFGTYESSVTTDGHFDPRLYAYGPGLQWFPRPHFEVSGQAQVKHDETWSKKRGYMISAMGHYYL